MEFKDRINALRTERNMSFAQLASIFENKKSEAAIRAWELGRSKPDADTLVILAKYFECSTDYLLGLDNDRNREAVKNKNVALKLIDRLSGELFDTPETFFGAIACLLSWSKEYNMVNLPKYFEIITHNLVFALYSATEVELLEELNLKSPTKFIRKNLSGTGIDITHSHETIRLAASLFCFELIDLAERIVLKRSNNKEAVEEMADVLRKQYISNFSVSDDLDEYIRNAPKMLKKYGLGDSRLAEILIEYYMEGE